VLSKNILTSDFEKSFDEYVRKVKNWSKIDSNSLLKISYLFTDKPNFCIYQVVNYPHLSLSQMSNKNYLETIYPNLDIVEAEKMLITGVEKLLKGIRRMHKSDINHLMITPANIYIDSSSDRKLILSPLDFNISPAKRAAETKEYFLSTYNYRFSENVIENSKDFDIKCLAYTFAATLFNKPLPYNFGIKDVLDFDVEPPALSKLLEKLLISFDLTNISLN